MQVKRLVVSFAVLIAGLGGCALQPESPQPRQDPLIGQIIDATTQQALSETQLIEQMLEFDVVYLGERHDNAEHHQIQRRLIQALVEQGQRPAIGFEFFDIAQTGYLMHYVAGEKSLMRLGHGKKTDISPEQRLRRQLGWMERDDEDWGYYFSLIELAREHQLEVFGADLPRSLKLRLSRADLDRLTPLEQSQMKLGGEDDEMYREFMYQRFRDGHCGWGSEPLLRRLYRTWNARNQRMAESIVAMSQSERQGPVVMIVGAGHVEYNKAVVERVARLQPHLRQLNLALQEIRITPAPLEAYLHNNAGHGYGVRYDLLWFTQRQDYQDPCAALNKPSAAGKN